MPIDLSLTSEHQLVAERARAVAQAEIAPYIADWDAKGEYRRDVFAKMGDSASARPSPRSGAARASTTSPSRSSARSWSARTRPTGS
jgi:hypothetical protein